MITFKYNDVDLPLFERYLIEAWAIIWSVQYQATKPYTITLDGEDCYGDGEGYCDGKGVFAMAYDLGTALGTLVHEICHMGQSQTGRFRMDNTGIYWEGSKYYEEGVCLEDVDIDEYYEQPWEIEAYAAGDTVEQYIESFECGEIDGEEDY